MQVNTITINAANLTAERGMTGTAGISGGLWEVNSVPERGKNGGDPFGPACRVTISEEGKALSRQQDVRQEKSGLSTESARTEKLMLRLSKEEADAKSDSEGIRQELDEMEKKLRDLNSSFVPKSRIDNDPAAKEAEEQLSQLRDALKRQREYQLEESQRLAKEAGQAGAKSGRYQEEIDENNRELATLLKTIEESEKAERQREGGAPEAESSGGASDGGGAEVSPFKSEADRLMTSTVRQELAIDDMFAGLSETADWFMDTAKSVMQSAMERSAGIRTAMEEGVYSDEEIAGMAEDLRGSMPSIYQTVEDYRGFGLYLKAELRTEKIDHYGNNSMRGMKEAQEAALQGDAAAALGEARQGVLDGASDDLTEEVQELIDRRNDTESALQEEEKAGEEKFIRSGGLKIYLGGPTEGKIATAEKLMESEPFKNFEQLKK